MTPVRLVLFCLAGATVTMQIQTSFLRVKEEAATAIAAIAEHLGADLEDWLGDCIGVWQQRWLWLSCCHLGAGCHTCPTHAHT